MLKKSDRWKQINEEYGVERIRDRHKPQAVVTNSRELSLVIPAEWATEESRENLMQVIHNFSYLWEREELKEVPPAVPSDSYGKKTVSLFLPADEIDQLKADFKAVSQSFRRKGVVLSHLLSRLDVNTPVMPPKMELGTKFRYYPPELIQQAKKLSQVPPEEHELYSAEFEAFKESCREIHVSSHTLFQKCKQGKL